MGSAKAQASLRNRAVSLEPARQHSLARSFAAHTHQVGTQVKDPAKWYAYGLTRFM